MNIEKVQHVGPSGIDMVYQRFGNPASAPVFLIMGGGAQMIAWPDGFCMNLVDRGLQVVRFDNHNLHIPTLVIHGKSDKMIDVSGGIATAEAIPDARLVLFEGMGHGLPEPLWTEMTRLIADLVLQAETQNIYRNEESQHTSIT